MRDRWPEQAEGRKVDARSDIFSFGSVLYEMATGRKPFAGDSRLPLLSKIVIEDPKPPRHLAASIPPDLEKIILHCLRKDPARRYQYMADVKVALEDVEEESASGQHAVAARPSSRRRWAWTALLPVLLAASYFAWQCVARAAARGAAPGRRAHYASWPGTLSLIFSRRQLRGVHVDGREAGQSRHLCPADRLRHSLAPDHRPRGRLQPVWSPDGRWIAFLRGETWVASLRVPFLTPGRSELRLIPPLGGPDRKLAEIRVGHDSVTPPHVAWCPDSNCLVVTDSQGEGKPEALFVVSLETGEKSS